jgi:neutral ceramidase
MNCRLRAIFTSLALVALALSLGVVRADEGQPGGAKGFRAGAFAIDITPTWFPVLVSGGSVERGATEAVDPLHARCLVLDDGQTQLAIVVVDTLLIPCPMMDEIKQSANRKTGIPVDRMLISATHTHTAPSVYGVLGTDRDDAYAEFLPGKVVEGIERAYRNLAPARIGWAMGADPTNVFCRRFLMKPGTARTNPFTGNENDRAQMNPGHQNPNAIARTGPADPEVAVVSIQTREGRPLALVSNYSTHYAGSTAVSADYFGVFCTEIEKRIGAENFDPPFVAMLSNGTSGDANCHDFIRPRREFDRFTVGRDVAEAAFQAYQTIQYYDWVPLVMDQAPMTLGVRKPTAEEVQEARPVVESLPDGKPRTWPEIYARETLILDQWPDTREITLQAIRIGQLGITALPNEVYGSTGLWLKAESPLKPIFNVSVANGYAGYLPPPGQHKLGGYTTWRARSSFLEEEAEPKIVARLLEMLNSVTQQRSDEALVPSHTAAQ